MVEFTQEEINAAIEVVKAVRDAIRALGRVPSGHLYAQLMSTGITLAGYERVIQILKDTGSVKEENHELIWIGK